MSPFILVLSSILASSQVILDEWQTINTSFAVTNISFSMSNICSYQPSTNTILLMGNPYKFYPSSNSFTNIKPSGLTKTTSAYNINRYGSNQGYTYANNTVYYCTATCGGITSYNINDDLTQSVSFGVRYKGCLSISDNGKYLFATGGTATADTYLIKEFRIYDIKNQANTPGPNMNYNRGYHSCLVLNGYLWVIGGAKDRGFLRTDTIERINIQNIPTISSERWVLLPERLSIAELARSVILHGDIIVFSSNSKIVDRINSSTMTISQETILPADVQGYFCAVSTEYRVYLFCENDVIYWVESIYAPSEKTNTYPFLYYDRVNEELNWKLIGNSSINSSPNCPTDAAIISEERICVHRSINSLYDGEYELEYYNSEMNMSTYYNTHKNIYIFKTVTKSSSTFVINDYETNEIKMAKCKINSTDVFDCNSKWKTFYNSTWVEDSNMISISCTDRCIDGNYYASFDGRYEYYGFDELLGTNIYFCEECSYLNETSNVISNGYYLFGWTQFNADVGNETWYLWRISRDIAYNYYLNPAFCKVTENINIENTSQYIFNPNDCADTGSWFIYAESYTYAGYGDGAFWEEMTASECTSLNTYRGVTFSSLNEESKICVNDSHNSSYNGEYKWLYYNSKIEASIYYNIQTKKYLIPYVTADSKYIYYLHNIDVDDFTEPMHYHFKCTNINGFQIAECIGNWQYYHNNTWNNDSNMITTPCTDIRITGADSVDVVPEDSVFVYLYYNKTRKTNIYICLNCMNPMFNFGLPPYLYGWIENNTYSWLIDYDYNQNKFGGYEHCKLGTNLGDDYIFKIDDCLEFGSWETWKEDHKDVFVFGYYYVYYYSDIHDPKYNTKAIKYNDNDLSEEICAELKSNGEIYTSYLINETYNNFAIGFDMNIFSLDFGDVLTMQYGCINADQSDSFDDFVIFDYDFDLLDSSITNIVYSLSKLCDG
eukprot:422049_1